MYGIFCNVCGSQNVVMVRDTVETFDFMFLGNSADEYVFEDAGLEVEEYLKCTHCSAIFDQKEETIKSLTKKL